MIKENDLLTINYTNGDTSRPKGMMTTQRNAYMNSVGTLVHEHLSCVDRYLRTLPMFHAVAGRLFGRLGGNIFSAEPFMELHLISIVRSF
jgi:long-subunit acyl-CoA synthetase (AMP-forming)